MKPWEKSSIKDMVNKVILQSVKENETFNEATELNNYYILMISMRVISFR